MDMNPAPAPADATAAPTQNSDPAKLALISLLRGVHGQILFLDEIIRDLPKDEELEKQVDQIFGASLRVVRASLERRKKWDDAGTEDWHAYMHFFRKIHPNLSH